MHDVRAVFESESLPIVFITWQKQFDLHCQPAYPSQIL